MHFADKIFQPEFKKAATWYLTRLGQDLVIFSLAAYILLFLLDSIRVGFVSFYFELNLILWLTAIGVLLILLVRHDHSEQEVEVWAAKPQKQIWFESVWVLTVSLLVILSLALKIRPLDVPAKWLAVIVGVLIPAFSIALTVRRRSSATK